MAGMFKDRVGANLEIIPVQPRPLQGGGPLQGGRGPLQEGGPTHPPQQRRPYPPSGGVTPPPPPPSSAAAAAPPGAKDAHNDPHNTTAAEIPAVIYDVSSRTTYHRGRLLGKGGFARCFEVTEARSNAIYACKIVNKGLLLKQSHRDKMAQEIKIHRDLRHEFVVNFLSYFEDGQNVYITLELCSKKTLMELQKRRRIITEPEARYFMRQIVLAVQYLHDEKHIIHRDLKLGNIFISEQMCLKIGDFGLATTIEYEGERKKTLCGTPNYIAPEVLSKKGHSYQVDIWSIGCILYTLVVGRPPFETATLRDTYHRIKRGEYFFPQNMKISDNAKNLLYKLLQVNPDVRPRCSQILLSEFMTNGYTPTTLPSSVLTMAPRFGKRKTAVNSGAQDGKRINGSAALFKKPLTESNQPRGSALSSDPSFVRSPRASASANSRPLTNNGLNTSQEGDAFGGELNNGDIVEHMKSLRDQIKTIIDLNPKRTLNDEDIEDPSQCPLLWVCKWVDYSDKYGFGYHLSDDSIGVSFNDQTKIILLADTKSIHYVEKTGKEQYHSVDQYPEELQKKVKLLRYFQQYMQENLVKATGGRNPPSTECIARVPHMWTWFRTSRAVVMVLSNGTLQINNFLDHSKMVLCPLLGALTTLGSSKLMRTYKLSGMEEGVSEALMDSLKYAYEKVAVILERGLPKDVKGSCYLKSQG